MKEGSNTVIESLGVYLPPRAVSTEEVLRKCRRKILFPLEQITGIHTRHMAENEYSFDLAVKAVAECLEHSKYLPQDIDLLICCNISRYDALGVFTFEPSTAVRLREKFDFGRALTLDISNACAGVFTGIYLADCFLKAGSIQRAMVVSGEYITHLTETAQRELKGFTDPRLACLTLGDSGAALILERSNDPSIGFLELEIFTLARYSRYCIAKASDRPGGGAIMLTDVLKLSSTAIEAATAHAVEVQSRAGWPPELLNHLIMHQTSERTIAEARERVNEMYGKRVCTERNTITNLGERGNTATTSHFVAFRDHVLAGRIQPGENVMFSINASGLTIGTSLYVCDDLPQRLRNGGAGGGRKASAGQTGSGREHESRIRLRVESVGLLPRDLPVRHDTLEMARCAGEACLNRSRYDRSDIDVLIHCGIYRSDYICEPAIAAMIASDLALNDGGPSGQKRRILCFDVLAGSVGQLKSCCLAANLIQSGRAQRVMIVASEIECNSMQPSLPQLGLEQSGSAILLEASPDGNDGFLSFDFRDFSEYGGAFRSHCDLTVPGGALKFYRDPLLENIYLDCIERSLDDYLIAEGVRREDIRVVLAPQISRHFLERLGQRIALGHSMIVAEPARGDLYTSSLPYAFQEAADAGRVQSGDIGLFLAAGSGVQVGCALYRF